MPSRIWGLAAIGPVLVRTLRTEQKNDPKTNRLLRLGNCRSLYKSPRAGSDSLPGSEELKPEATGCMILTDNSRDYGCVGKPVSSIRDALSDEIALFRRSEGRSFGGLRAKNPTHNTTWQFRSSSSMADLAGASRVEEVEARETDETAHGWHPPRELFRALRRDLGEAGTGGFPIEQRRGGRQDDYMWPYRPGEHYIDYMTRKTLSTKNWAQAATTSRNPLFDLVWFVRTCGWTKDMLALDICIV